MLQHLYAYEVLLLFRTYPVADDFPSRTAAGGHFSTVSRLTDDLTAHGESGKMSGNSNVSIFCLWFHCGGTVSSSNVTCFQSPDKMLSRVTSSGAETNSDDFSRDFEIFVHPSLDIPATNRVPYLRPNLNSSSTPRWPCVARTCLTRCETTCVDSNVGAGADGIVYVEKCKVCLKRHLCASL